MRFCFLAFYLFVRGGASGQELSKFTGHWMGEMLRFQAGKKAPQKIKMQLIVQPTDTAGQYTWQIIYGERSEDNRPYILKPVDTSKGHWMIDERNGILIDQYWIGNRFTSTFTVQNSTILNSYWMENDLLIAEFYSISAKPVRTSGAGTENIPSVSGYSIKTYQKAILKKKSN